MKFNEKNVIIQKVLSNSELADLRSSVNKSYNTYIKDVHVQQISDFEMPKEIADKIVSHVENITGLSGFEMNYQFSRYELLDVDGKVEVPNLRPHFDAFSEPRFTFDYQLDSNVDWPIYVEGKEFILKNNEALTFSGTHQVHWRPKKDFVLGEFIEMIFCHLYLKNNKTELGPDHMKLMEDRSEQWSIELESSNG